MTECAGAIKRAAAIATISLSEKDRQEQFSERYQQPWTEDESPHARPDEMNEALSVRSANVGPLQPHRSTAASVNVRQTKRRVPEVLHAIASGNSRDCINISVPKLSLLAHGSDSNP
jgi:hypothetical protein